MCCVRAGLGQTVCHSYAGCVYDVKSYVPIWFKPLPPMEVVVPGMCRAAKGGGLAGGYTAVDGDGLDHSHRVGGAARCVRAVGPGLERDELPSTDPNHGPCEQVSISEYAQRRGLASEAVN